MVVEIAVVIKVMVVVVVEVVIVIVRVVVVIHSKHLEVGERAHDFLVHGLDCSLPVFSKGAYQPLHSAWTGQVGHEGTG